MHAQSRSLTVSMTMVVSIRAHSLRGRSIVRVRYVDMIGPALLKLSELSSDTLFCRAAINDARMKIYAYTLVEYIMIAFVRPLVMPSHLLFIASHSGASRNPISIPSCPRFLASPSLVSSHSTHCLLTLYHRILSFSLNHPISPQPCPHQLEPQELYRERETFSPSSTIMQ